MASYYLKGIEDDKWKHFKAACNLRGCTAKQSFIDHINIIVAGFNLLPIHTPGTRGIRTKGGNKK